MIGAFAGSNPAAFHAEDGSGYQFLVEMLTDLNSRNPQVASRLIEPLIRLKRYDAKRQEKMRAALEQLKGLENTHWRFCTRRSPKHWLDTFEPKLEKELDASYQAYKSVEIAGFVGWIRRSRRIGRSCPNA